MAQSDASIEADLELKKRARRRLVGAAALALFAAIVLPMVMDHEPRPPVQDIQVRIPSQDGNEGFKSHIVPAKPAPTPLPPVAAVAESKPAPEQKAEPKPEPKAEPKPEPKADPKKEAKAEAPATKAEAAPAASEKQSQAAAAKAPEKPQPKPAEPPKAAEHKAEESHAASEQWVVQLGAYKEAGNVKLLLSKLKEMGVPAYTEKFDAPQGQRTRVRAGPFATKEAAEKARAKAKIIGVDGPVAPK